MPSSPHLAAVHPRQIPDLLRGRPELLQGWVAGGESARLVLSVGVIVLGAGIYGAAIGSWRSAEQALYTAAKLPLILLLTTLGNALVNGLLAPLLGLNVTLRQSASAILLSHTLAAVILAAFAPLVFFEVWNLPPMGAVGSRTGYALLQVTQVGAIAFAGVAANARLLQLLRRIAASPAAAERVLLAWLGVNLLLGAQLTWILRPFFGTPALPVQFLRSDALSGNFFEALAANAHYLLTQ